MHPRPRLPALALSLLALTACDVDEADSDDELRALIIADTLSELGLAAIDPCSPRPPGIVGGTDAQPNEFPAPPYCPVNPSIVGGTEVAPNSLPFELAVFVGCVHGSALDQVWACEAALVDALD